jgi:hypothetical protein
LGDLTTSSLDPRTAPLQIRPAASAAVRAADPSKERFEVGEKKVANQDSVADEDQTQHFTVDADESGDFSSAPIQSRSARGGRGLLGAFTNFLAKIFTQADGAADSAASTRLNGIGAYGRATSQTNANPLSGFASDVQAPGLPRLASGRILDLTI